MLACDERWPNALHWLGRLIERLRSVVSGTPALIPFEDPAKKARDHRALLNLAFITEDPRLLPELAMLLADPLLRQEACDALAVLLRRCDLKRYRWLDHILRGLWLLSEFRLEKLESIGGRGI